MVVNNIGKLKIHGVQAGMYIRIFACYGVYIFKCMCVYIGVIKVIFIFAEIVVKMDKKVNVVLICIHIMLRIKKYNR